MFMRRIWLVLVCLLVLSTIASTPSLAQSPSNLSISQSDDALIISIISADPFDIYGLTFAYTSRATGTDEYRHSSYDFAQLQADNFQVSAGQCFVYQRENSTPTLPDDCSTPQTITLSNREVFWEGELLVLAEYSSIGACDIDQVCDLAYQALRQLHDDFSDDTWNQDNSHWDNWTGICTYGQSDGVGTVSSVLSTDDYYDGVTYCSFAFIDPVSRRDVIPLSAVGGTGLNIKIASAANENGLITQTLGLYAPLEDWWLGCGLHQDYGIPYAAFEMKDDFDKNVYVPIDEASMARGLDFRLQLYGTGGTLQCLLNGQLIAEVALIDIPVAPNARVIRTVNSTRFVEEIVTHLDNAYTWETLPIEFKHD